MDALDGNAIAGTLYDAFGTEMTTAAGVCANCGTRSLLAETRVYLRAPGTVVRCSTCTAIVMVLVDVHGVLCVDARGLAGLEPAPSG